MSCPRSIYTALVLALGAAVPASAVTMTFDVEVTQSILPSGPEFPFAALPALGTRGTITISLPGIDASDTEPFADPDSPPNLGSVEASLDVGTLFAALEPGGGSIAFATDTLVRFSNGSFSSINVDFPRDDRATPTYAGSFRLVTPADGSVPTTFGDVATALGDPAATAYFSFNGTTFDGIDTAFRVDTVAPVPLPAGGLLLLSGLGGVIAMGRRRTRAA